MKPKKITYVTLLTLFISVVTGCGGNKDYDPDNFLPTGTATNPYRIVNEPVTIKIFAPHSAGNPQYKDLVMFNHLSEVTGLNFEFTTPDTSAYTSQRSAIWQTGQGVPDLFLFNNSLAEQIQYVENNYDAFVPYNDDSYEYRVGSTRVNVGNLIDNYMPHYSAGLTSNFGVNPALENAINIATLSDGYMYTTLSVNDVARDLTFKMFINQQWIDNLNNFYGLNLPNADEIQTLEQYLMILRAFKRYDANDNGNPDDEIPVTSKSLQYLRNFILAGYGYVQAGMEIEADGSAFTFTPYTSAYRKYLQFMNTLWREGLLHNATFSITTDSQMAQYGTQNRLGSFVSAAAYLTTGYSLESQYVTFGPLTSADYTGNPLQWGFGSFKPDGACIPQQSKYVREVARLVDIMYSDLGKQLISYGIEGVNWNWDDDAKTSWTFTVPSTWTGNQEQYRATITPNVGSGSALYWSNDFVGKMNDDIIRSLNQMSEIYRPYLKNPEPREIKMNSSEYNTITQVKAALDPQLAYLEASYVRGTDNGDPFNEARWEAFKNTLRGYGADSLVTVYNNALTRHYAEVTQ